MPLAILVLLLVFLALFLYKYRRTRRVQAFLSRFTPFTVAPYTDLEKKRSSMGAGLLFTDGYHGDVLMDEKRHSIGYGTILAPPLTHPDRATTRPERADAPPPLITTLPQHRRPGSPISPFEMSPMSPGFPQSPPHATVGPRRSSQDSLGGISIASSGIFSPSLMSWPMPPSTTGGSSPPTTSHGPGEQPTTNLADLAARYKPLTPTTKPSTPARLATPATPSNWQKPAGWD